MKISVDFVFKCFFFLKNWQCDAFLKQGRERVRAFPLDSLSPSTHQPPVTCKLEKQTRLTIHSFFIYAVGTPHFLNHPLFSFFILPPFSGSTDDFFRKNTQQKEHNRQKDQASRLFPNLTAKAASTC